MNSYLFYDLETTGLNRTFDQVVQFAAIRTDKALNRLEEHNIKIRLRPDIIPSPGAMLTHGIPVAELAAGPCEFDAIATIHRLCNTPGTITIGYNSLGFDDEFLRFSFYRNLLPPYTHQYANGCYRMDLLPMVTLYWLYNRKALQWPDHEGKPSLKLEHINTLNQLARGKAHDALVDVKATVELARRLQTAPEMWDYLSGSFVKTTDIRRMDALPLAFETDSGRHTLGLLAASAMGSALNFQTPVLFLGGSDAYRNQTLWLRLDLPELQAAETETIDKNTWVIRKKAGESGIILPPLDRYWSKITPERQAIATANIQWLQTNPELFEDIVRYHAEFRYPVIPNLDVDAALYQSGFWSNTDQEVCRAFHTCPVEEKASLISKFKDKGLRVLAQRVIFRNFAESGISVNCKIDASAFMQKVAPAGDQPGMPDFRGNERLTPHPALTEIKQLLADKEPDAEKRHLLKTLEMYIAANFGSA